MANMYQMEARTALIKLAVNWGLQFFLSALRYCCEFNGAHRTRVQSLPPSTELNACTNGKTRKHNCIKHYEARGTSTSNGQCIYAVGSALRLCRGMQMDKGY